MTDEEQLAILKELEKQNSQVDAEIDRHVYDAVWVNGRRDQDRGGEWIIRSTRAKFLLDCLDISETSAV